MFEQGFTVLRVRGIPVRLHLSLIIFLPYVAFLATRQYAYLASALDLTPDELRLAPWVWGVILAIALFVSVLLHELAHSLVALKSGARVRSITLMILGGVSLIEDDLPPLREAWMAFVGPLASFALAGASYALYRAPILPLEVDVALFCFAITNAALGVFNLLPAFPMDGGRVVRGLLAGRLGVDRATRVAATMGQAMAVLFALYAVVSFNLLLLLIAWFVWAGAAAERSRLAIVQSLRGLSVTDFMSTRIGDAWVDESVGEVLGRLAREGCAGARVHRHEEPDPRVAGVVSADDLEGAAERGGAAAPVSAAMEKDPRAVHAGDDAAAALGALSHGEGHAVMVLDASDRVVGLVTPADVRRAMLLGLRRN